MSPWADRSACGVQTSPRCCKSGRAEDTGGLEFYVHYPGPCAPALPARRLLVPPGRGLLRLMRLGLADDKRLDEWVPEDRVLDQDDRRSTALTPPLPTRYDGGLPG